MSHDEIILLNSCIFKNANLAILHRSLVFNTGYLRPLIRSSYHGNKAF